MEKPFITILEEKGKMGSRVVYALILLPYVVFLIYYPLLSGLGLGLGLGLGSSSDSGSSCDSCSSCD
ncbi:MAG: hypothetical protein M3114_03085, partial [Thermoproteota archaeon]|nr:hypothetical protein [Thermoproteota archaeon]